MRLIALAILASLAGAMMMPDSAMAQTATPAPATTEVKKESRKSAARTAASARQKKCGAEWREAKAAGKVEKAMTWPKYWSACNKRLKASAT